MPVVPPAARVTVPLAVAFPSFQRGLGKGVIGRVRRWLGHEPVAYVAMEARPGSPLARRRKLFVMADELGLTDSERIEMSRFVLWRDITTWKTLTAEQVDRMLDALEGAQAYLEILRQRP